MSGFPQDEEETQKRYNANCSKDPFPNIPPALLNSADISDYARETGMIFPFVEENLKSASYSICIGKRVIYWDGLGNRIDKYLKKHQMFCLPKDSIVFVETEEQFNLPDYLAVRFNLKIDIVHRGILLGTGPLVDPGFQGRLLIPLQPDNE
jgi:deoxycytidine triphosphate deaminase